MEKRTEVKTVKVELACEDCGKGTMEPVPLAMVLTTNPPQYLHKCTECDVQIHITGTTYPYMEYK